MSTGLALTAMLEAKRGRRGRFAAVPVALCLAASGTVHAASVEWFVNAPNDYDYGRQLVLPPGFGTGEFTFELWIRPNNTTSLPGPTADGTPGQRTNWSTVDNTPYGSSDWWFQGNFLLDGHNNQNSNFEEGTFSLQFYGSGRVRWLFGDGPSGLPGGVRSVGAPASTGAPALLDGQWHHITLVRRFPGASGASLEIWIDGVLIDTTASDRRTDMAATYWNNWTGFPANQRGWFWAAEKQAAINERTQYEDYKGRIDEMRFWTRAKTAMEISTGFANPVAGNEPGLVGRYGFDEGTGTSVCDSLEPTRCIALVNTKTGFWSTDNAPLAGPGGDTTAPTVPGNLRTPNVTATAVTLAWDASTDNVGVTSYRVFRGGVEIGSSATTSFVDNTVAANTTYSYTVQARDAAGNVSQPAGPLAVTTPAPPSDTTPPTVPANLRTTSVTAASVTLAWNASTDNVGVTSYRVLRGGVEIGSSATTSFTDATVAANTAYTYTVEARDAAGNTSQASAALAVTTPAVQPPPPPPPPAPSGGGGGGTLDGMLLLALLVAVLRLFVTQVAGRRPLILYTPL